MTHKVLDGALYRNLLDYGIRNLSRHCDEVNALNVFPVPDGDTGTNMVITLRIGFAAIERSDDSLPALAAAFSRAIVYGARGNSGVILSQFFKGFSESIASPAGGGDVADCNDFVTALSRGVDSAYRAVSRPAEGTILTVLRESTEYVARSGVAAQSSTTLADLLKLFLSRAKISLENTPNLLPVLKAAGVVDSGGLGIIYVFKGMLKYLRGESIDAAPEPETASASAVDYSLFNRKSRFDFGYCTEFLLQLLDSKTDFDEHAFKSALTELGDSIVCSVEDDKVKVHIHTPTPEKVLTFAHAYGEFLSLKIENMSVQHSELENAGGRLTTGESRPSGAFAVVAVGMSTGIAEIFTEMGADVVITATDGAAPSAGDFIDAYIAAKSERIIVFPNNPNLVMTAEQARDLYGEGDIVVLDSKSIADCYASLALIDFDCEDLDAVVEGIRETIENVYALRLTAAARDAVFSGKEISCGDIIAMHGRELLASGKNVAEVAKSAIRDVMCECERDTLTVFTGALLDPSVADEIMAFVNESYVYTEVIIVRTDVRNADILLSFE